MLEPGSPYGRWETSRGSATTWILPPNLLLSRCEGHLDAGLAQHIVDSGNVVVTRHGSLLAFHDWYEIRSYDSEARVRLTDWGSQIKAKVTRVHVLVGSKLVKMGVSVASMVLGNMIVAYDDRRRFEAAWHAALQSTGGSPR